MKRRVIGLCAPALLVLAACSSVAEAPARLQPLATQTCSVFDGSREQVAPGVTLTYDSAFLCEDAPSQERYTFTATVTNEGSSASSVTLDELELRLTTPRPRGASPDASGEASGLPLTLAPGESGSFTVSGSYELVSTDEGDKANLHFRARGTASEPFNLGLNAHLRGSRAEEDDNDGGDGEGPPSGGPGGPPPWAGRPR